MMDKALYIRGRILERNIASCKDITPDQMEIISILSMEHDVYERTKKDGSANRTELKPLLSIELEDETAIPKVFYKGEEIESKTRIQFDWETRREHIGTGGVKFHIEHGDKSTQSVHTITCKRGEFIV